MDSDMFLEPTAHTNLKDILPPKTELFYTLVASHVSHASSSKPAGSRVMLITTNFDVVEVSPTHKPTGIPASLPKDPIANGLGFSSTIRKCPGALEYITANQIQLQRPQGIIGGDVASDGSVVLLIAAQRSRRYLFVFQPRSPIAATSKALLDSGYTFSAVEVPEAFECDGLGISACGRRVLLFSAVYAAALSVDVEYGCPSKGLRLAPGHLTEAASVNERAPSRTVDRAPLFHAVLKTREATAGSASSYVMLSSDGRVKLRCLTKRSNLQDGTENASNISINNTLSASVNGTLAAIANNDTNSDISSGSANNGISKANCWVTLFDVQLPKWTATGTHKGAVLCALNKQETALSVIDPQGGMCYFVPLPSSVTTADGPKEHAVVTCKIPRGVLAEHCAWHPDGYSGVVITGRWMSGVGTNNNANDAGMDLSNSSRALLFAATWGKTIELSVFPQGNALLEMGNLCNAGHSMINNNNLLQLLNPAEVMSLTSNGMSVAANTAVAAALMKADVLSWVEPAAQALAESGTPMVRKKGDNQTAHLMKSVPPLQLCFLTPAMGSTAVGKNNTSQQQLIMAHIGPSTASHAPDGQHSSINPAELHQPAVLRLVKQALYGTATGTAAALPNVTGSRRQLRIQELALERLKSILALWYFMDDCAFETCLDEGFLQRLAQGRGGGAMALQASIRDRQVLGPLDQNPHFSAFSQNSATNNTMSDESNSGGGNAASDESAQRKRFSAKATTAVGHGFHSACPGVFFGCWTTVVDDLFNVILRERELGGGGLDMPLLHSTKGADDRAAELLADLSETYRSFLGGSGQENRAAFASTVRFAAVCHHKAAILRPFRYIIHCGGVETATRIAIAMGNFELRFCDEVYPAVANLPGLRDAVRSRCSSALLDTLQTTQTVASIASADGSAVNGKQEAARLELKFADVERAISQDLPQSAVAATMGALSVDDVIRLAFLRQLQAYQYPGSVKTLDGKPGDAAGAPLAKNATGAALHLFGLFTKASGAVPNDMLKDAELRTEIVTDELSKLNAAATPVEKPPIPPAAEGPVIPPQQQQPLQNQPQQAQQVSNTTNFATTTAVGTNQSPAATAARAQQQQQQSSPSANPTATSQPQHHPSLQPPPPATQQLSSQEAAPSLQPQALNAPPAPAANTAATPAASTIDKPPTPATAPPALNPSANSSPPGGSARAEAASTKPLNVAGGPQLLQLSSGSGQPTAGGPVAAPVSVPASALTHTSATTPPPHTTQPPSSTVGPLQPPPSAASTTIPGGVSGAPAIPSAALMHASK